MYVLLKPGPRGSREDNEKFDSELYDPGGSRVSVLEQIGG